MPKSLNELDKKTLHSYRDKARLVSKVNKRNAETMDNVAKQRAQAGDMKGMGQALDSAKRKRAIAYKRDAGSDRALKKLKIKAKDEHNYKMDMAKRGPQKAPSDDEMKKMAKHYNAEGMYNTFSMKKVDKHDIPKRGLSPAEKKDKEDIVKGMKKNKTDFMKRYGRDHEAVMHATATKLAKQDEETLHELDKDTLKSYVGKAQAERLHNIDKFEKQSKRGESIIAKSALKKVHKRGLGIRQAQKKLGEAEFDADKPKRGIQRKRVNLQFGRQQRHNPTPFKKDQQQDLYKKSDSVEKKIRKSRENNRFPDYRQDKDTGIIKKEFKAGGEHSKKYGGVQNKKTKPDALVHKEDKAIKQLKTLMSEKKSIATEDLRDWFKDKWVRMDTKGNIKGDCAREPGEGKPKCLPQAKAHSMSKEKRAKAARRKRREDPVADRPGKGGKPINVKTEERVDEKCWDGWKQQGMKKKGKRIVPNCVKENKYDLYSSGEHKTAHRFAEKEIDRHLAKAKKMKDYHTARTHMDKVLSKHAKHGSDDSEPHQIVTGHLNNHFGTKHGHNDHLDFMKGRPEYSGPRVKPVKENFKDGRNPQDKGDAKRHGLSGKQSTSSLKKVRSSDSASPRKKQLAHWILNMRKGRNKKK